MLRPILLLPLSVLALCGQIPKDPSARLLDEAYKALRAKHYDSAIESFRKAIDLAPDRAAVRKDLAYTYLKIGETEAARGQFSEAMRLAPGDHHAALEFAFLCYETGKTVEARRVFDRVRMQGDPASRETAGRAFQNVDRSLAEGIEQWTRALALHPDDFSAHHELARLAAQRDDWKLAAAHFERAWQLRPDLRSVLVELGRARRELGEEERAMAALLAASRGAEPRAAEDARSLMPARYPYVDEFRQALSLDPKNVELRRELAYLLLEMGKAEEAKAEFAALPAAAPAEPPGKASIAPKEMARRSYEKGYLQDALTYYSAAQEADPLDFGVMLQLGWTNNLLRRDRDAIRWFALARRSPEPAIAAEAAKAERNLKPRLTRFRTSAWIFPSYSSRWRDVFTYGQLKADFKLSALPLRAYASIRFIGDTRTAMGDAPPQYLSESSVILGVGLATDYWHGLMLWGEAGSAINYLGNRRGAPRMAPDYRGGLAFYRGFGRLIGTPARGMFFETNGDGVFVSRFQNDVVLYSQNRFGLTLPAANSLGGLEAQLYWNGNASTDLRRQYWANVVETGPGLRFRWKGLSPSWLFSVNFLRGAHTRNVGNPRSPNFFDLRVGIWYSVTR
ncbi:MAG TPA: tetratricopeptide repeat protein [Bryobacteraceae bacterium]|nr:tetratricopeptide repeat protein [Bryobacteraceae bacterium]